MTLLVRLWNVLHFKWENSSVSMVTEFAAKLQQCFLHLLL